MAHSLLDLPPRGAGDAIHVVVDTPRGSAAKLKLDAQRGAFVLKRMLPAGLVFPFDFGFVPGTCGEDGDPVDVLLLSEGPLHPGVLVEARLVGAIEAEQREGDEKAERNDRLVAVAALSRAWGAARALDDLPDALVGDIEGFFVAYNAGLGRTFRLLGRADAARAGELLGAAVARASGAGR
jgi:inorganic pyrophosphatase